MRCMVRNKIKFYYASYIDTNELTDGYGNKTGEYKVVYGNPTLTNGNISGAQGEIQNRQFGESESYDKVIVLDKVDTPIDEYSILWVDTLPLLNDDGTTNTPHDYIVKKVAKSINSVSLAIRKVDVRG